MVAQRDKEEKSSILKQACAHGRMMRVGPQKLNLVAGLIRGVDASNALMRLESCRKAVKSEVLKVLDSAIANAKDQASLDVEHLYVREASVGRDHMRLKRLDVRARSKSGQRIKQFSRMRVVVAQKPV